MNTEESKVDQSIAREVFALSEYRKGMAIHALIGLLEFHTGKSGREILHDALEELETRR